MRTFKYYITGLFLFFLSLTVSAQNTIVSGKVVGIDGAIENVKVSVVNTNIATITNTNGEFSISIPESNSQITFKYKGVSQTITPENSPLLSEVFLVPTEKKLYKSIIENEELRLCDIYLKYYNEGANVSQVKGIQEKAFFIEAYNIAAAKFSDTALRNYLKVYPEGAFVQKANDAIEIASWQKARFDNTSQSYQNYLSEYPDGKAVEMAKAKIAELEK